jgi:hypothetical protein
MTIDEAIDLCKVAAEDIDLQDMPRFSEAIRLGIEALKVFKLARAVVGPGNYKLLPGETESPS